jgi:photosystem II stability/assembly factor-like uncharacterized protein
MVVQALAASPNYAGDHTLFAGTEADGIYRSTDSWMTWALSGSGSESLTVNCLWLSPRFAEDRMVMAGTSAGILRSHDGGTTWQVVYSDQDLVLSLAGTASVICAGLMEQGVLRSEDGGDTWSLSNEGLAARAFLRTLAVAEHPGLVLAFGPQEGIVVSADGSANWESIPGLGGFLPLSAMATANQGAQKPPLLVASTAEGQMLRSADGGLTWAATAVGIPASTLVFDSMGQRAWAATGDGYLFASRNAGVSWEGLPRTPFAGESVLAVVPSPYLEEDHTLLVGSLAQEGGAAHLWRSLDDGRSWDLLSEAHTDVPWLALVAPPVRGRKPYDRAILGAGRSCIVSTGQQKDTWTSVPVGEEGASVLSLAIDGSTRTVYAGTNLGLYRTSDTGRTWRRVSGPLDGQPILDLQVDADDRSLLMLVPGGTLWRCQIR